MTTSSLIFVDARVSDYAQLMAHLPTTAEVVVLDSATDGLQQMADYLAGRTAIEAIHVVSHGSQGALYLGNVRVDGDYLTGHSAQLASIGNSLPETGDILLYGCNVAQGEVGLQFVQSLADLTGADVAASSNATGTVVFGGDVVLEQSSGSVQATALTLEGLSGVLGVNTAPGFTAGDGKVITDFGSLAYGQSIVLQTDGKILVAGFNNSYDFALARYNADGSLDIRFSSGGKLTTDFLLSTDQGHSVTLQADGKILVAGSSGNYYKSYDFALARYNADGSLARIFHRSP